MKSKSEKKLRRKYDEKFKEEVVRRHVEGESAGQLAEEFGISSTTLIYRWKEQALGKGASAASGASGAWLPSRLEAELREVRRELKRVEQERDILKKALAIFSQGR